MKIVCAGEITIDRYIDGKDLAGGTTFNVAKVLKRLDEKNDIYLVSAIDKDDNGEFLNRKIKENNITSALQEKDGNSSIIEIKVENGERFFPNYNAGVLEDFKPNEYQKELIRSADAIFYVCFEQLESFFRDAIQIKSKGIKVADFTDLSDYQKEIKIVEETIDDLDILFFGLDIKDKNTIINLKELADKSGKLIVITLGKEGSHAFWKGNKYFQDALKISSIVDTTGAGDTFIATFTYHFLQTQKIDFSLNKATIASAATIQKVGI